MGTGSVRANLTLTRQRSRISVFNQEMVIDDCILMMLILQMKFIIILVDT